MSIPSAIDESIDDRLLDVHTALPGRVESYDAATQLADVKPLIPVNGETLPVIPKVPVCFPRTASTFIHLPLAKGDFVILLFPEQSIGAWRALRGAETSPGDLRRHSITSAYAIPCGFPDASKFTVTEPTKITIKCAAGVRIEGDLNVQGALSVTGAITAGAEITAKFGTPAAVKVSTHTHPTGVGPSGPPTPGS